MPISEMFAINDRFQIYEILYFLLPYDLLSFAVIHQEVCIQRGSFSLVYYFITFAAITAVLIAHSYYLSRL